MSNKIRNAARKKEKADEILKQQQEEDQRRREEKEEVKEQKDVEIFDPKKESLFQKIMNMVNGFLLLFVFFFGGAMLVNQGFDSMTASYILDGIVIVGGIIWYFAHFYKGDLVRRSLDYQYDKRTLYGFLLLLFAIIWYASQSLGLWYYQIMGDETFDSINTMEMNSDAIVVLLFTIIVAPICEEILCRALIYNYFKRTIGWIAAILLTSFLFGFIHGTMVQMITAGLQGIMFNLCYELTGDLRLNIGLHMINNTLVYVPFLTYIVPYKSTLSVMILAVIALGTIIFGFLLVGNCNNFLKKSKQILKNT